ncbi:MAG: sigma-70 family RNA polymerase sigma factor [Acidobacteriales bacterium]|nr:sigma-70 family RNA polymerase sigma factor [Terriglobales bacterium]
MDRDQILARLRERIVGFAASRIGRDMAEDLAQEVLLVLHRKYAHLDALEDLLPLSLKIVRFKMVAELRKSHRRGLDTQVSTDDVPLADDTPGPFDQAERREMLERLEGAMTGMGERCRQLFRLKLEGKSFPEIRELMGVKSINTIYTWDFRCRKELIERLGGNWEQEP